MTKIAIAARYADDTAYGNGAVTVRLVDAGAGAPLPGGLSVVQQYVSLDSDGEAVITLTPTADVGTPDTYYALTVVGSSPTVVRYIEVPAANGSGDEEIPYDWDDPTIERLVPDPPSSIPAAGQGTVGQVIKVVDNGDGKEFSLEDAAGGVSADSDLTITAGSVPALTSAGAVAAWETFAGAQGVSAARTAAISAVLPDVVTEAGTSQLHVNKNLGRYSPYALVQAALGRDEADAATDLAVDGEAALRSTVDGPVTVRQFEFCAPWGDDHDAKSWSTPKPASFSGGAWCEALVTVTGEGLPASPTDGDKVWQEIWTQTADGLGAWDGFEGAVESEWSAAIGQWIHRMFWEHTATGGTAETYQITSDDGDQAWRFTEGIPTRVAVWIDFTDGTNSHGYLLREAPEGSIGDLTAADRHWRIIRHKVDAPTDIDPGITDPWYIGAGNGGLLVPEAIIRNGGPSGTILASPNAAAAWAEADGAFDDAQGNTWTPGPDAATQAGTAAGAVDSVNGQTGVVVLDATDVGAATASDITSAINALIGAAPGALDTLDELAAALADDASFASTVTTALAGKVAASLLDAKGDLIVATANDTPARLGVGANGTVPHADSNSTPGLIYAAPHSPNFFESAVITPLAPYVGSTLTMVNNRMYLWPFHVPRRLTFDRIGVNHLSGVSSTGVIRFALYAPKSTGGIPDALITDFSGGTVDPTTAAAVKLLTISQTLDVGTYWVGVVWQGTGTQPGIAAAATPGSFTYPDGGGAGNVTPMNTAVSGIPPNPAAPNSASASAAVVYVRPA